MTGARLLWKFWRSAAMFFNVLEVHGYPKCLWRNVHGMYDPFASSHQTFQINVVIGYVGSCCSFPTAQCTGPLLIKKKEK